MANFDKAIELVLKHEGSTYTETPGDRGGATKFGITVPTLVNFDGKPHDADDVRVLTLQQAKSIYLKLYWNKMCCQDIHDQRLATIVLDQAVLCGTTGFAKTLQTIVGTMSDGIMGAETVARCNSVNTNNLILDILSNRTFFYINLVTKNTSQLKFLKGWESRVVSLYDIAFRNT